MAGRLEHAIIIPTFNQQPEYLRAAVLSALWQTVPCHVVVVDDGSTPPQQPVVDAVRQEYEQTSSTTARLTYLYQSNRGVAGALNCGIRHAMEEHGDALAIQWLSSDDLFVQTKTDIQGNALAADPYATVSYCAWHEGVPRSNAVWPAAQYATREDLFEALKKGCFINACTVMWHRVMFERVGLFDERIVHAQDYEFILRCAEVDNFVAVNEPLVRRRIHATQMVNTLRRPEEAEKKARDMAYLKERYGAVGAVWIPS